MLALDARHTMHWEACGRDDGVPLVFLHGGPGGGSLPHHRRFYDPAFWRIVLYDQRGAGRSTPVADLVDNTTSHLVAEGLSQRLSDIALTVTGPHGVIATFDGRHPDGDPVRPLVWLVNFLGRHGATLQRGQIVTTGSYAGAIDVPLDLPLTITFGTLGGIGVHLLAAS